MTQPRRRDTSASGEARAVLEQPAAEAAPEALAVRAGVARRGVDVEVFVPAGQVCAVVGPNGAGKSTLVQLITGELRPDSGSVALGGRMVSAAAGPGRRPVHVPVHRRGVAVLSQRALLFPHLSVGENVAFGLRARGMARDTSQRRALAALDSVGAADWVARRPAELSGGQAQRVAFARALATEPEFVVLDEPFAALDVAVASDLRALLRYVLRQRGRTALIVTHDLLDVLTLADTVVALEGGRVAASGPAEDVVRRPPTPFLAQLGGVNLLVGTAVGGDAVELAPAPDGRPAGVVVGLAEPPLQVGARAFAAFAPEAVGIYPRDAAPESAGSPRTHLAAVVSALEPRGPQVRVVCRLTPGGGGPAGTSVVRPTSGPTDGPTVAADLTAASAVALGLQPGVPVWLVVKAVQVRLYPR